MPKHMEDIHFKEQTIVRIHMKSEIIALQRIKNTCLRDFCPLINVFFFYIKRRYPCEIFLMLVINASIVLIAKLLKYE